MAEEKNSPKNEDLTVSPSDIERIKPENKEQPDATLSSDDEEDILNGDPLEDDPEVDNDETIGIP
jgi:hypothetical protein